MASLTSRHEGVPLVMSVGDDGTVNVLEALLSIRFGFRTGTIHVEQEVFDSSGGLEHSIYQVKDQDDIGFVWNLCRGSYKVYGVLDAQMFAHASCAVMTPPSESGDTVLVPGLGTRSNPSVQLLSNTEDDDIPNVNLGESLYTFKSQDSVRLDETTIQTPGRLHMSPSLSFGKPPVHPKSKSIHSIIPYVRKTGSRKGSRSELARVNFDSFEIIRAKYLPPNYNGDMMFELPPLPEGIPPQFGGGLDGMSKQYDGHTWCKTMTTNIMNDFGLTYRKSTCTRHLQCPNLNCDFRCRNEGCTNQTEWSGLAISSCPLNGAPSGKSTSACKVCQTPPICLALCDARIYYVTSTDPERIRLAIHLGYHHHPISKGVDQTAMDVMHECVAKEVQRTPKATNSAIIMAASKNYLSDYLICPGSRTSNLEGTSMDAVLDQFETLSSPNIRNLVSTCKRFYSGGKGVMDNIMELKELSKFVFIHENKFPGQSKGKVSVFKMSVDRPGSGVDLVRRMQPGGDLQDCWLMFDHVKRVKDWTTMACHVYDSKYCRVMTIAMCDMQSEDAQAQQLFWENLNDTMINYGVKNTNFKGFMADSAGANWHAVRRVYGSGDKDVPMENRERTCLFHWTKCLQRATNRSILPAFQDQHIALCKIWKNAKSQEEAEAQYNVIRGWWVSSGTTTESGRRTLEDWMAFWHFRYRQWGGAMQLDLTLDERADMPSCNLAETVHNRWLQQSGNTMTCLYAATVDDLIRAFMQITLYRAWLKGGTSGKGPNKGTLRLRSAQRSGDPKLIAEAVRSFPGAEDLLTKTGGLEGVEIFGSSKRKLDMPPGSSHDSHRSDTVNYSIPRDGTRVTRARIEEALGGQDSGVRHTTSVLESDCDPSKWHIACLSKTSHRKCQALQAHTREKCDARVGRGSHGTPAPTYIGRKKEFRSPRNSSVEFWFCADDIGRCVKGSKKPFVVDWPSIPMTWPVKLGTNLTMQEVLSLEEAGFQLEQRGALSPRRQFRVSLNMPLPRSDFPIPANPDSHHTFRNGYQIRRTTDAPSVEHRNKWSSAVLMNNCYISNVTTIPYPGFGCVITLQTEKEKLYCVTFTDYPACTCPDFLKMSMEALGKKGQWKYCKHVYYILRYLCKMDYKEDLFIHAPSYSFNEVMRILELASIVEQA